VADATSITGTDLNALRAKIDTLPSEVTSALKTVAHRSARNIAGDAARRLRSQQKTSAHALADAIIVIDDSGDKKFIVESRAPASQPANVTIWNEHGTAKMAARPYMRPSADAERASYTRECEAVATAVFEKVLG
jgi:HK97 gp10 family phage protein